jgi:hypothetical protein
MSAWHSRIGFLFALELAVAEGIRTFPGIYLTNWVIFEHGHGEGCPGARKGIEEAGHGHRNEAHEHCAGLGCAGISLVIAARGSH